MNRGKPQRDGSFDLSHERSQEGRFAARAVCKPAGPEPRCHISAFTCFPLATKLEEGGEGAEMLSPKQQTTLQQPPPPLRTKTAEFKIKDQLA